MSLNDIWPEEQLTHVWTASHAWSIDVVTYIKSPIPCHQLQLIGFLCVFLFSLSLFANLFLLWVFAKKKSLRIPMNMFVITLTVFNVIGTLVEWPVFFTSQFFCG